MNSLYIVIAVSFVTLQGCTFNYVLTQEDVNKGVIPIETSIRVTPDDSRVIESGPFRHVFVQEAFDFVIRSGSERKSGMPFAGKVLRSEIDSTRTSLCFSQEKAGVDSTTLILEEQKAFFVREKKSNATAVILSLLLTSTGHAYGGNWTRGLLFSAGRIGSGVIAAAGVKGSGGFFFSKPPEPTGLFYIGVVTGILFTVWEAVDASREVDKYNEEIIHTKAFDITISPDNQKAQFTFHYSF